jgi:hypothetical protein
MGGTSRNGSDQVPVYHSNRQTQGSQRIGYRRAADTPTHARIACRQSVSNQTFNKGYQMSINRRDFSKVLLGVAGGVIAGAQLQQAAFAADAASDDKHSCKGVNQCKGKGGCKSGDGQCAGKNSCKGKGGCATAKHECKAHNDCKGQGGCKSGDNGCAGKNSCKGKGGCKSPVDPTHMQQ